MKWLYALLMILAFHLGAYAASWKTPVGVNLLVGVAAYLLADILDAQRS